MIKEVKLTEALIAVGIRFHISHDKRCYFVYTSRKVMERLQECGVIGEGDWARATDSSFIIYRNRMINI